MLQLDGPKIAHILERAAQYTFAQLSQANSSHLDAEFVEVLCFFFSVRPVLNLIMCKVHRCVLVLSVMKPQRPPPESEELTQMRACSFVIQYPNKNVALVASDILHLLISYVDHLQKFPPETPKKIVEVRHALPCCVRPLYAHNIKWEQMRKNHHYNITMQCH